MGKYILTVAETADDLPREPNYMETRVPVNGRLRFIEVKGRVAGAKTVTVTKNESLTALNKPDDFMLAIVRVDGAVAAEPVYLRQPFLGEPDSSETSRNYDIAKLVSSARWDDVSPLLGGPEVP